MRTNRTWLLAAVAFGLLGVGSVSAQEKAPAPKEKPESAQPQTSSVVVLEQPPLSSRWFVRGEWVYLQRDTPRLLVATQRVSTPPPTFFFDEDVNIHDLIHFENEHGLRLTAGRIDERGGGVEISYLGLSEWDETAAIVPTTPGAISSRTALINVAPFNAPALYDFQYASKLHNLEVNARRGAWARDNLHLALMAGVRYSKVEEDFIWTAVGTAGNVGVYASSTENDLFGVQLGGHLQIDLAPGLAVSGVTKAGAFVNFSEQNSSITSAALNTAGDGEDETVAAVVELGASVHYQLGSNIRLSAGYHALLVYGLALAPRQLQHREIPQPPGLPLSVFDNQNGLNYGGSSIYHGPTLGIEFTW